MTDPLAPKSAAEDRVLKNLVAGIIKPTAKDELEQLFDKMHEMSRRVATAANPMIAEMTDTSRIHKPTDRKELFVFLHKAFLDEFCKLNRDELIFMLAYVHADGIIRGD
jgi:phage host-nuclease inhibitor protein Gam